MKINFTLLLIFYFSTASFLFAQNISSSNLDVHMTYKSKHYPPNYTKADFFNNLPTTIKNNDVTFEVKGDSKEGNRLHSKLQQYYKSIEIIGATYILHFTNGNLDFSNGRLYPEISIENKIDQSKEAIKAKMIKNPFNYFPLHANEKKLDLEFQQPANLVLIDRSFPSYSGQLIYAYEFKVHSNTSLLHSTLFINAEDGRLIFDDTHICTHSVPGTGQSYYYGEVNFECEQLSSDEFILRDPTRGNNGINITNGRTGDLISSETPTFNLSGENYDNTAIDALYCTTKFYDLMSTEFDWEGLDNNGLSMNCVINTRSTSEYINAFWNGFSTHYGNGTCSVGPLTTMSIIGHEFMHGITDYTSDLIYFDESGALNESLSDIFGKYLESLEDPSNFTWELDSKVLLNSEANPFRSMSDPNLFNDPDTYGGEYWREKGSRFNDNSYVHSNSGVLNYWYYLLSEGKSGTNDHGTDYNVPAIGMESAIQVLWKCQKDYLTSTSSYNDLAIYSIEVAEDLYGLTSVQYEAVLEAWKAVGVDAIIDNMVYDLTIEILNSNELCIADSTLVYDIELTNVGNVVWDAGSNVLLQTTSFFQPDEEINYTLTEDLEPGESVIDIVTLEEKFSSNFLSAASIEILIIDEKDENHSNNSSRLFATQYSDSSPFITVRRGRVYPICNTNQYILEYQISNNSCQSIDEPISLTLEIYNGLPEEGDLTFSKEINFEQGMNGKANFFYSEEFDAESIDLFTLDFAVLKGDYTIDNPILQFILKDDINLVSQDRVFYDYEDDSGIGIWGGFGKLLIESEVNNNILVHSSTSVNNRDISCKTDELIFHQENSFFASISSWTGCVDFSDIEFTEILFDTKMFRNDDGNESSAMIRVRYEGNNGSDEFIIKGLNEDEWYTMQYDLPSYFVGDVTIELFAHKESFNFPFPVNDAIFLDNLYIGEKGIVSTKDILSDELALYPNPVNDVLYIENKTQFDFLKYILVRVHWL